MSDWIAYRQHKLTYSSEGWEVQDLGTSRLVSGKHPFFMLYPHMEEVVRGLSGVFSFYQCTHLIHSWASLVAQWQRILLPMQETQVWSLSQEGPHGGGNSNPFQYSFWENSMDRGTWQATICGVIKSRTWLSMHVTWPESLHFFISSIVYLYFLFFIAENCQKSHFGFIVDHLYRLLISLICKYIIIISFILLSLGLFVVFF